MKIPCWPIRDGICSCPKGGDCSSPGKHPRTPNGLKDAREDWGYEHADANWALITGAISNTVVIDLDRKPGKDGFENFKALAAEFGGVPRTRAVRTGSGGLHLYFNHPGVRVGNSVGKLTKGVDVRGDGGYVMIPPSNHISGGAYELALDIPPIDLPAWLLDLVRVRVSLPVDTPEVSQRGYFPPASSSVLDAARRALELHGPAIENEGGDDKTYRACALLTHDFALTNEEAWPLLVEWNEICQPPWGEDDLRSKLRGGLKYGKLAFGCKRVSVDALTTGRAWIAEWKPTGAEPFDLIRRCRTLRFSDPAERGAFIEELHEATGVKIKDLAMPAVVNVEAAAEREARKTALDAGANDLIDAEAPAKIARQFLATTNDAEGRSALVRWQGSYWRAEYSRYVERSDELVVGDLYRFLEGKRDVTTNAEIKPNRASTEELWHALRAACELEARDAPAWISGGEYPAEEIIAFTNGLLHVPTRTFIPATRRFFNLNTVTFDYQPDAPTPENWYRFLLELWGPDREALQALQEFCGLALTSDTSFQKMFMLIGPKRSGKGTIVRVLQALVGKDNHTAPTLNGLGQQFGLQSLLGKQLAVVSDARLSGRSDLGAIVENLLRISGEDEIAVPRKHKEDWTAKLSTRFLVVSNEVPGFLDQSGALASRFIVLQLVNTFFGHEDRTLTEKLLTELPGILLWALRGLDRLRERGHFVQPASALETLHQLETLASPTMAFVGERCTLEGSVDVGALFSAWRVWSEAQGRDYPGTLAMFTRNLHSALPRVRQEGQRFVGIRLNAQAPL